jgi:hypothetical protein
MYGTIITRPIKPLKKAISAVGIFFEASFVKRYITLKKNVENNDSTMPLCMRLIPFNMSTNIPQKDIML